MRRFRPIILLGAAAISLSGCSLIRSITRPFEDDAEDMVFIERGQEPLSSTVIPAQKVEIPMQKVEVIAEKNETLAGEQLNGTVAELLNYAKSKLGCKYKYASSGPDAFDCSGFTSYVFGHFGINLSRSSASQYDDGVKIKKGDPLKPGDLVFWSGRSAGSSIGHVGIVVEYNKDGSFTFIHAASTGVQIDLSTMDYYAKRYKGACRIIL